MIVGLEEENLEVTYCVHCIVGLVWTLNSLPSALRTSRAPSVWTRTLMRTMRSSSVRSATWPCTSSATMSTLFPMDHGMYLS